MRPTELFDEEGRPEETEEAQATLFKIEKEMAEGFHKNEEKQDRKKAELDATQHFRVPISVGRQPTRFSYRITQNNLSGEVHQIDQAATCASGSAWCACAKHPSRKRILTTILTCP